MKDAPRNRFGQSLQYAVRGIRWMVRHEPNMRFHLVAASGVIVAAALLRLPVEQWAALIFAIVLVLLGETLNTAIEVILDLVQPEHHDLVGVVKDIAAGAVLVASVGAVVIALLVFVPAVWDLIS